MAISGGAVMMITQKPRRVSRLIFLLFLPTSLVVVLVLALVACNGYLCIVTEPITRDQQNSIREAMSRSPVLAVREEFAIMKPEGNQMSPGRSGGVSSNSPTTQGRESSEVLVEIGAGSSSASSASLSRGHGSSTIPQEPGTTTTTSSSSSRPQGRERSKLLQKPGVESPSDPHEASKISKEKGGVSSTQPRESSNLSQKNRVGSSSSASSPPPPPRRHESSNISQQSSTVSTPQKVRMTKRTRAFLKELTSNPRSKDFTSRAHAFLHPPCTMRFFMTWISSLSTFGRRESFAIETLFHHHPTSCLLILSSTMDTPAGAALLQPFTSAGYRVAALTPNYRSLLSPTPAGPWFSSLLRGSVHPGDVPLGQNLSNLLRLAALYKYGGAYLDTDVLVLRSFLPLRNAIGAQAVSSAGNWTRLNNAVMVFDEKHPLVREFMEEFVATFDGSRWGYNGPYLVSRVVERAKGGGGFVVMGKEAFYPVDWSRIGGLFRGPVDGRHRRWVETRVRRIEEDSYAVHLWNRESKGLVVEEGSVVWWIMRRHCLLCNSSSSAPVAAV